MVKRKYPEKYAASGYVDWGIKRTIAEAENVARWSPWHAHAWMDEARDRLSLDTPYYSEFNAAAKRINNYWFRMTKYIWYDESKFWEFEGTPLGITFIELI